MNRPTQAPARARPGEPLLTAALAAFFLVVQLYTSLAPLSPTPPVGYVFVDRAGAAGLVAVLVAGAAVALLQLSRGAAAGPRVPAIAVAGFGPWLGAAALSSALGVAPLDGLQIVGMMLLGAAFSAALIRFATPARCRALLATYLVSGGLFCAAALAMLALRAPLPLYTFNSGRAAGIFVTANQFAAYLILLLPVAAGVACAGPRRLRGLALAVLALGLPALALTFSRAGWLGAGMAACVLAFALGRRRLAGGLALAGGLVALVLLRRPQALAHNPDESLNRLAVWQGGVRAIEAFPLTGAGPMAYWRIYPALRPPDGAAPGTFAALHPHDVVLSLGADLGLAGLACAVYGWRQIVRAAVAAAAVDPRRRILAWGFGAAFAASLVAGLFDTIGVVQMCFVWIPYTGVALAVAERGLDG